MDKATNPMLQDAGLPLTTGTNDTENEPLKPVMMNAVDRNIVAGKHS